MSRKELPSEPAEFPEQEVRNLLKNITQEDWIAGGWDPDVQKVCRDTRVSEEVKGVFYGFKVAEAHWRRKLLEQQQANPQQTKQTTEYFPQYMLRTSRRPALKIAGALGLTYIVGEVNKNSISDVEARKTRMANQEKETLERVRATIQANSTDAGVDAAITDITQLLSNQRAEQSDATARSVIGFFTVCAMGSVVLLQGGRISANLGDYMAASTTQHETLKSWAAANLMKLPSQYKASIEPLIKRLKR